METEDFPEGLSEEFYALYRHVKMLGYTHMRLDSCGDEVWDLPVFDWNV